MMNQVRKEIDSMDLDASVVDEISSENVESTYHHVGYEPTRVIYGKRL